MHWIGFLPAALAALTDCLVKFMVLANQGELPGRVIVFQAVMFAAALAVAAPQRWIVCAAFVLLFAGVLISGFSVGAFYIPTVLAAAWSVSRRSAL